MTLAAKIRLLAIFVVSDWLKWMPTFVALSKTFCDSAKLSTPDRGEV